MIRVCDSTEQVGNRISNLKSNYVEVPSFSGRTRQFPMPFPRRFILAWACPCRRCGSGYKMLMDVLPEFSFVYTLSHQIAILGTVVVICRLILQCRSNTVKEISTLFCQSVHSLKTPHIVLFCPVVDQLFTLFRGLRLHLILSFLLEGTVVTLAGCKAILIITDHFENVNKGTQLGCECLYKSKQTENLICFIRICRRWHQCSH